MRIRTLSRCGVGRVRGREPVRARGDAWWIVGEQLPSASWACTTTSSKSRAQSPLTAALGAARLRGCAMPRRTPRDARRRALGQNFLHDQSVVADVIGTLHPPPGALVVDLGAGAGALTSAAAARGARVIAVELDPNWTQVLRTRAPSWGDVTVVAADALRVPFPAERFYVVSSAPYGDRDQARPARADRRARARPGGVRAAALGGVAARARRALRGVVGAVVRAARARPDPGARVPAGAVGRERDPHRRPAFRPAALAGRVQGLRGVPDARVQRPRTRAPPARRGGPAARHAHPAGRLRARVLADQRAVGREARGGPAERYRDVVHDVRAAGATPPSAPCFSDRIGRL